MQTTNWPLRLFGCVISLVLAVLGCGLAAWAPMLYNNWQLGRFAQNLYDYPLPPQTQVVSRHAEVGLMGNGNHCDYIVRQAMLTSLEPAAIEAYYEDVRLPAVNNHNEGLIKEAQGRPLPVSVTIGNAASIDATRTLTVSLFDYGYSPGLDIRCH